MLNYRVREKIQHLSSIMGPELGPLFRHLWFPTIVLSKGSIWDLFRINSCKLKLECGYLWSRRIEMLIGQVGGGGWWWYWWLCRHHSWGCWSNWSVSLQIWAILGFINGYKNGHNPQSINVLNCNRTDWSIFYLA